MDETRRSKVKLSMAGIRAAGRGLPAPLAAASRGVGRDGDPFLNDRNLRTRTVVDLSRRARDAAPQAETLEVDPGSLLVLETEDGFNLVVRADKFHEDLARIDPTLIDGDGVLQLDAVGRRDASRGLGDWLFSRVSVVDLEADEIVDQALAKARELAGGKALQWAEVAASWAGTRALMWAIESRLERQPGLYRWLPGDRGDGLSAVNDAQLAADAAAGSLLVFVHGTASSTNGSFDDLHAHAASEDWSELARAFGRRIYALEHRTFSESPIENALALAEALPAGARINLVSHSRGGLVCDLLCMAAPGDALLTAYRRGYPRLATADAEAADRHDVEQLGRLTARLAEKQLVVQRYVRVASPARGTRLASANLDVFLSALLSLIGRLTPLAGSLLYSAFKRIVLEIAHNRTDPALVPGLEAMLPESPLAAFLARVERRPGTSMAVIAGDIDGGGLLKRLAVLFTDHVFFDAGPNDLVVDTDSMYQGVARAGECHALFEQGPDVNHFRYFTNTRSRRALRRWLTAAPAAEVDDFQPLAARGAMLAAERFAPAARGAVAAAAGSRPVLFVLPGIMGSHLEIRSAAKAPGEGDRVWFDFGDLVTGGLARIAWGQRQIEPEALFDQFYGELCESLASSHEVVRFPYDWRKPVAVEAERLATELRTALERSDQPVRVLAHSMGGLVARAAFALHADVWDAIAARDGGRFVMLGTPNNGSHLLVEMLIGKGDTVRNLARIDVPHDLQEVVDIVAGFRGALALLPRPGFADTGGSPFDDYYRRDVWSGLKPKMRDFWFGNGITAVPGAAALREAARLWRDTLPVNTVPPHPERVAYVFGSADSTACGLSVDGDRVRMKRTPRGDGSVSWDSGRLPGLAEDRYWYMAADHGALASTEEHFPAIAELLETGITQRLPQQAPARRDIDRVVEVDAGPVPYPSEEELFYGLLGSRPPRPVARTDARTLSVGMRVMDLRYVQAPVLCGHCLGDVIAGAEAQVDRYLVDGELKRRLQLGLYADQPGESVVVLVPRREAEIERNTAAGAVVVGLGPLGRLGIEDLRRTVRTGVLAYLLAWDQRERTLGRNSEGPMSLPLASLLLGHNSTTEIGIEASIDAVVQGVCEANRQFAESVDSRWQVTRLEFIELFLDSAISAAYALRKLPERLGPELAALGARVSPDTTLSEGEGARERLYAGDAFGYWPQLRITDADRVSEDCGPECYDTRMVTPIPREAWEAAARAHGFAPPPREGAEALDTLTGLRFAQRLQFELTAARAKVSRVRQQRQPGLVERLVEKSIGDPVYREDFARTLYQLLVPTGFKSFIREHDRLVLQVDEYTANIPWEMLVIDGEPVVRRTRLVRKFITSRNQPRPELPTGETALVIGDPSTSGFRKVFGGSERDEPVSLAGARAEARAVVEVLEQARYRVESSIGEDSLGVLNRLYARPYRVLHVAAHGLFAQPGLDGIARTGVVLSDGTLLTAAEIGQLEYAPDFVFLNCCHLGKAGALPATANRLAYSVARELIDMDVRCVVVAGWAVDDAAAKTFAQTFYRHLLVDGDNFGDAVHEARRVTLQQHGSTNTWGAYQAYGDAGYLMQPGGGRRRVASDTPFASQRELHDRLRGLISESDHAREADPVVLAALSADADRLLLRSPDEWRASASTLFLLGMLYRQLGDDFLGMAVTTLTRAVEADSRGSGLPLKAVEQLANAESSYAERVGGQGRLAEAMRLVNTSIRRLSQLSESTGEESISVERAGLTGSAWKRKARLLALQKRPSTDAIGKAMKNAADAYGLGSRPRADGRIDAWCLLNRLQLDALRLKPSEAAKLVGEARRCALAQRDRFATTLDFWDAVTGPDALLAVHMLDDSLPAHEQAVIANYREVLDPVPGSRHHWGSVVRQHRVLAALAKVRGRTAMAESLARIADALSLGDNDPGVSEPPPAAATRKRTAKKKASARRGTASTTAGGVKKTAARAATKKTATRPTKKTTARQAKKKTRTRRQE